MEATEREIKRNYDIILKESRLFLKAECVIILILHILYLIYFSYRHFIFMSFYNIFSIILYLFVMILLNKYLFSPAIVLALFEILLQTIFTSYMIGNEFGFYLFNFIATIPVILKIYKNNKSQLGKLKQITLIVFADMILFYISCYIGFNFEPFYKIDIIESRIFFLLNAGTSFVALIIIGYMVIQNAYKITQTNIMTNRRLNSMASTDSMTKLLNRRSMYIRLGHAYERYVKEKTPFSVLMMDVDFFKKVNDTY